MTARDTSDLRETDIVRGCLEVLRLRNVFAFRVNCGAMKVGRGEQRRFLRFTSINGVSDIIGVLPDGRFLGIEVKRAGNVPSDDQRAFLDAVTRRGGLALLIYDVADLISILDRELDSASAPRTRFLVSPSSSSAVHADAVPRGADGEAIEGEGRR